MLYKVQYKILAFLLILIIVFLGLLLAIVVIDKSELNYIISSSKTEKDTLLKKAVNVKSSSLKSFAYDYSYWDDLIDFIKTGKKDWAYKNIDIVLPTYNAKASWVYNKNFEKIYSSTQNQDLGLTDFPLEKERLEYIFKNDKFPHFFLKTEKGLFEIAGGPVQPTGDSDRVSTPQGYFIAGRHWTDNYLREISEVTSSTLKLLEPDEKRDTIIKDYNIKSYISLKDNNGKEIKVLESTIEHKYIREIEKDTKKQHLMIISSVSGILFLIFAFFYFYINKPLIAIEKSLSAEDLKYIDNLIKSKSEFGYIARLIKESFLQKQNILKEIEARKITEEELKESKYKAEESNRMKTLFLANMSHELRTPLTAIIGFSEILKNELKENEKNSKIAFYIEDASKRLMNTLNLILELAQLETTDYKSNFRNINIAFEINSTFSNFKYKSGKKNLELLSDLKDETLEIFADDKMVSQIIYNLLDNAYKFTNEGYVKVSLEKTIIDNKGFALIKVEDTGIGIAEDKIEIIFEEFRQASEGYNREYEGAGLGLTIAKRMTEYLNGRIHVESKLGKGSVFYVYIPLALKSHNEVIEMIDTKSTAMTNNFSENDNNKPRILLVEDNDANIQLIKITLMDLCDVEYSYTAEDAIEKAKKYVFDAVLMDINLGAGLNGIEAAKIIKNMPGYENTKFAAVTGYASMKDKENFLKNEFDNYISKPFSSNEITDVIKSLLFKK